RRALLKNFGGRRKSARTFLSITQTRNSTKAFVTLPINAVWILSSLTSAPIHGGEACAPLGREGARSRVGRRRVLLPKPIFDTSSFGRSRCSDRRWVAIANSSTL